MKDETKKQHSINLRIHVVVSARNLGVHVRLRCRQFVVVVAVENVGVEARVAAGSYAAAGGGTMLTLRLDE